jgi:hypothetical protein
VRACSEQQIEGGDANLRVGPSNFSFPSHVLSLPLLRDVFTRVELSLSLSLSLRSDHELTDGMGKQKAAIFLYTRRGGLAVTVIIGGDSTK